MSLNYFFHYLVLQTPPKLQPERPEEKPQTPPHSTPPAVTQYQPVMPAPATAFNPTPVTTYAPGPQQYAAPYVPSQQPQQQQQYYQYAGDQHVRLPFG